jgi:dephospho-CoA kinase
MKPILVTGKMFSGKSTLAERLIAKYAYPRFSMAEWIKTTICKHYGLSEIDKSVVINGKSFRTLMQEIGMYMRKVDSNWHIDELLNKIKATGVKLFVIDDIRFKNEVERVKSKFDCIVIKIVCDELQRVERGINRDMIVPTESQLNDISEREIDDLPYDYLINNNGNAKKLFDELDKIMEENK